MIRYLLFSSFVRKTSLNVRLKSRLFFARKQICPAEIIESVASEPEGLPLPQFEAGGAARLNDPD
jgi:hypothetical protein